MVPVLLTSSQIFELLEKLNVLGDKSFQIRSTLLFEQRYPSKQYQVWVDLWPEFTSILIKQRLSEELIPIYYVFTLEEERLKMLLENTDIMEWEHAIFRVYPIEFHEIIKEASRKFGFELMRSPFEFRLYIFNTDNLKKRCRTVPEDVTVGSLKPEIADVVSESWASSVYNGKEVPLIRYLIANYPTTCLYNMKGAPVAYELQQEYGGLGMLYVKPAYRKRGLGKLVTNFLLQKCADHGYPPYALIADDNEESGKLHTSIGFQKKDLLFIWSNIHPKTNEK